jgi:hypothetical protein
MDESPTLDATARLKLALDAACQAKPTKET